MRLPQFNGIGTIPAATAVLDPACTPLGARSRWIEFGQASRGRRKRKLWENLEMKVGAFTKSFKDWDIPTVCRRFREIGLDGLDLTVSRGGHIEPSDVAERLPAAARSVLEAGLEILCHHRHHRGHAGSGAGRCRHGPAGNHAFQAGLLSLQAFGDLAAQLDATRRQIGGVIQMAKKRHLAPCPYSPGEYLPSHGTQLYQLNKRIFA